MDSCTVCKIEFADEAAKTAHMEAMKDDPAHQNMGGEKSSGGDMAADGHDHSDGADHDH